MIARDLTGLRFGRLTARWPIGIRHKVIVWLASCDCGNLVHAKIGDITSGNTRSCGCLKRDIVRSVNITHGLSHGPEYNSWSAMIQRCTNRKHQAWKNYGGRGISVCKRWRKFENFYADMGNRPVGLTLERINNFGDYDPSNCKWANWTEQRLNSRRPK